ncbi:uncharacterized protein LOC123321969 [Coccinella septempunctata]|uniref:uncharacterized protein LOC123321969 n=1 Tax=Coccinella septempunctata TaxID=41139 RepID=UPI001D081443|nr:uncharacterized protein LOC123321969 [Coccinella septempunctata]
MDDIPPPPKLPKVGPSSVRPANLETTIRQNEGVTGGSSSSRIITDEREIPQADTSARKTECASCEKNSVLFERLLRQGERNAEKIEFLTRIVLKLTDDLKKRDDDGSSILTEFSIIESIPRLEEFNESLSDAEKFKEMVCLLE